MVNIEYRVRPVTRYLVTRFYSDFATHVFADGTAATSTSGTSGAAGSQCCGEFDREDMAEKVAKALADAEPDGLVSLNGYPIERCLADLDVKPIKG